MSDRGEPRRASNPSDGAGTNIVWLHDHTAQRTRPPLPDDVARGKVLLFTGVIYVQGAPREDGPGTSLGAEPGTRRRRRR